MLSFHLIYLLSSRTFNALQKLLMHMFEYCHPWSCMVVLIRSPSFIVRQTQQPEWIGIWLVRWGEQNGWRGMTRNRLSEPNGRHLCGLQDLKLLQLVGSRMAPALLFTFRKELKLMRSQLSTNRVANAFVLSYLLSSQTLHTLGQPLWCVCVQPYTIGCDGACSFSLSQQMDTT